MRVPRMTIRRWMVTVAFVAAIITAGQFALRSRRFQRLAAWHHSEASAFADTAAIYEPPVVEDAYAEEVDEVVRRYEEGVPLWRLVELDYFSPHPIPVTVQQARRERTQRLKTDALFSAMNKSKYVLSRHLADYHVEMSRKYRRAAIEPWRSVPPDLPVPIR
jgi:hypothetical protein